MKNSTEQVLILQGGGSLGAYECGVYQTLEKKGLEFDIISGSSIGAINATIIASSDTPAKTLKTFWMDISEKLTPEFLPEKSRQLYSTVHAASFGIPKVFQPESNFYTWLYHASNFPHMFDIGPFRNTIKDYVDFEKINSNSKPRLILTAVDIQKSSPVIFDSKETDIDEEHAFACIGYPFYGIEWTQKDDKYLWDGSLLSNTPLREVINSSPQLDKEVYLVSLFPRKHNHLPNNMFEAWHRARDIMHTDKTKHNMKMSKVISRQLKLLKHFHDILKNSDLDENSKKKFEDLQDEYNKIAEKRGAVIKKIVRIERKEESHFLLEDADFSEQSIQNLIKEGEEDAKKVLQEESI